MNIYAIRLENLRRLVTEIGTLRDVADLSDAAEGNLREILRGVKLPSGKPKGVGDKLARKLEEGCTKPEGWMDVLHDPQPTPHQEEIHLSPDEQVLLVLYRRASPELRRVIRMTAELARKKLSLSESETASVSKEQAEASAAEFDDWSIKNPRRTKSARAKKKAA